MGTVMNKIEYGVNEICQVVDTLNDIIKQTGPIDINNKVIWDGYLHRWDNEDWSAMLEVMGLVITETFFNQPWHEQNLTEAIEAFVAAQDHPRCMDHKRNKKKAWKMIMTMREVVNNIRGVRILNQ
jgi:hypothetical protein